MKINDSKGKLIVIEGTDGSGKETQSRLLKQKLEKQGKKLKYIEFPQYGKPSAAMIEQYLNGKLGSAKQVGPYRASIFYATDRYAASKDMKQWLKDGFIVICNRYVSANKGHQAGKIKDKEKLDSFLDWIDDLEYSIFDIPKPDKVFLLYMPSEIGQKLVDKKGHRDYIGGKKKDIHEADLSHLKDAEKAYLYVAEKEGWNIIECSDGSKPYSIEEINNKLLESMNLL